jgi:hypothetical protein
MTPSGTRTGGVLEAMILPALAFGGYTVASQVTIGQRIGGRAHRVDAVASKDDRAVLVSLKWQQVGGTAEQKVPFEVICLAEALESGPYAAAYLVLGGDGWTLREYFTSGALHRHLARADRVQIVTLEAFVRLANSGRL